MKTRFNFLFFTLIVLLTSCSYTLNVPIRTINGSLTDYSFCYVVPTSGVAGSSGVYGNQYGVYGGATKTTNPSEVISGYLMKKGYTILPEVKPEFSEKTLVVSYGYVGKRQLFLAYSQIVLVQFRDAKTYDLVASCEAEGCGETEADDIAQAINRALEALFNQ